MNGGVSRLWRIVTASALTTQGVQSSQLSWGVGRGWRAQGRWVEEHIDELDAEGLRQLVLVLDQENPELYKWLTQQEPAPAHMVRTLTATDAEAARRVRVRPTAHTLRAPAKVYPRVSCLELCEQHIQDECGDREGGRTGETTRCHPRPTRWRRGGGKA